MGFISYGLYLVHIMAFRLVETLFSRLFRLIIGAGMPTAAMLLRFLLGLGLQSGLPIFPGSRLRKVF